MRRIPRWDWLAGRLFAMGVALSLVGAGSLFGAEPGLAVTRLKGIRVAGQPSGLDRMAVTEFQAGMKRLYGAALSELKDGEAPDAGPVVVLGKAAALAAGTRWFQRWFMLANARIRFASRASAP